MTVSVEIKPRMLAEGLIKQLEASGLTPVPAALASDVAIVDPGRFADSPVVIELVSGDSVVIHLADRDISRPIAGVDDVIDLIDEFTGRPPGSRATDAG